MTSSKNANYFMQTIRQGISRLEANGIEIGKRWYLNQARSISDIETVRLAGFMSKYKKITMQGPEVTLLLARSYSQAYGDSAIVHFSPLDVSPTYTVKESEVKTMRAAILSIHLISALQDISSIPLDDGNKLTTLIPEIRSYTHYDELTRSVASVGDYVFVRNNICQVIEEIQSEYGYLCYHVRYIDTPPIPEITDDWFAAFEIQRLGSKSQLLESIKSVYKKHKIDIENEALVSIDNEMFEQSLAKSFHETLSIFRKQS